ncbi:MAG: nucleoside triphosphate pyrophosphohydrolase [Acidobacteria bacterium]|nr:MAG: nucleoside triphosphate pyrophosphohydrolase [Acidobacteriota bacterium]
MEKGQSRPIDDLLAIMAKLRGPNGCPWDREQSPATLRSYLLEEAHEVAEAIDRGDWSALREELGDLLLQVVFLARIAEEEGRFGFDDVAAGIAEKLVRRHPHVFGGAPASDAREAFDRWEAIKRAEKGEAFRSRLAGLPPSLPALLRAHRLAEKASRAGFRWPDIPAVAGKVREELAELESAVRTEGRGRVEEELGDLLFAAASLATQLGLDPEAALQKANAKFAARFEHVERAAAADGRHLEELDPGTLDRLWDEAKGE